MLDNSKKTRVPSQTVPLDAYRNINHIHVFELIWVKALLNLKSEVHRNYLGYAWWFAEPLLHMAVYYVVFGFLLNRGGPDFPVFLLTGLVPWIWFRKTISTSCNSIIAGERLMLQVGVPVISFPIIRIAQTAIKQLPVFFMLFVFLLYVGFTPGLHWFAMIPLVIVQALITTTLGCIIAAVIPFIRDLSYLVETGLMFLMFVSGIFYSYKDIPEQYQDIFLMNPAAYLIMCYRKIFLESSLPNMLELSCWGVGWSMCCLLVIWMYAKLQYVYPRVVLK